MPTRLDPVVGAAIDRDIAAAGANLTQHEIKCLATNYRTSTRTIERHQTRIQRRIPLPKRTGGQRRVITKEIDTAIFHLLNKFPWFYQDEIIKFLAEVFNIDVDRSTVARALQRIKFTRKKLYIKAAQRN